MCRVAKLIIWWSVSDVCEINFFTPFRMCKHLIYVVVYIKALHPVASPVMGYEFQSAFPIPWSEVVMIEYLGIGSVQDDRVWHLIFT